MTAQLKLFPRVCEHYRPINWFRLIADIKQLSHVSDYKIARQLGVSPNSVWSWYNGNSSPHHSSGEMLIKMWRDASGGDDPPRL